MADSIVPPEDLPEDVAAPPAADNEVPQSDLPDDVTGSDTQEKYGSGAQQAIAGVEGIAKGFAGPLATGAERLLGVPAEDIAGREEANPWTHGIGEAVGLGGGLLTGAGEAALLGKVGEAAEGAAGLGKIGSTALKGAIEGGLFQGGDEISKAILGQSDPETPVSSALVHMGASALLGGGLGGVGGVIGNKLSAIAEGKTASNAAQFLTDLGNRFDFLTKNKDVAGAATEEASNLWGSVKDAYDSTWGSSRLKDQAIKKLVPEMNESISSQASEVTSSIQKTIDRMRSKPNVYPEYLVDQLQGHLDEATSGVKTNIQAHMPVTISQEIPKVAQEEIRGTPIRFDENPNKSMFPWVTQEFQNPIIKSGEEQPFQAKMLNANPQPAVRYTPIDFNNKSSNDVFSSLQDLKQNLQDMARYGKKFTSVDPQGPFVKAIQGLAPQVKTALEDESVWGDAGKLQKGINSAFHELQPYQKDFLQSFGGKKLGGSEIDPDKIGSVLRQIGRERGALRGSKLADFIEPAKNFLSKVDDLHSSLGIQSSIPKVSTNVIDEMMSGKSSAGAKAADWLFGGGPRSIGAIGSHVVGTAAGAVVGHPYLGYRAGEALQPILEEGLGRKLTRWGVSGALRALSAGDHEGVPQAINYAQKIGSGAQKINNAIDNSFTVGGQKYLNHDFSETARESLKKYVADGSLNQQIENQKNQGNQSQETATQPPAFAEGGEVLAPEPTMPVTKPVAPVLHGTDHVSTIFPEQSMLLGAAKGRINNYLNSIRPQKIQPKLPFDEEMPDKEKDKSYDRALNIANKPLSILDHIKNGTLDPEHMQHMQGMYPELTNHLQKKITEKIVKAQMANERPPYKVRQGLSLFMGSPMDSTLTPQNMQAAQAVFMAQKAAAQQAPAPAKKGTSKLGEVSGQYRTAEQSAQSRQSQSKT